MSEVKTILIYIFATLVCLVELNQVDWKLDVDKCLQTNQYENIKE